MRKVLLCAGLLAALTVAFAGGSSGGNVGYPQYATPDGVAATPNVLNALAVPPLVNRPSYTVPESTAASLADPPPGSFKHTLWGYEAEVTGARILEYTVIPGVVPGSTCVPTHSAGFTTSQNGRGIAFDPLSKNLWNTHVDFPGFAGDGYVHQNTPPPACTPTRELPFGDGPGGTIQDDIGALDVDEASKHIWAASYQPVLVQSVLRSYVYLVNRNNGKILRSCWIPFRGGGVGNDTLTNTVFMEDISLCGYRGVVGGDGNDSCPYP